MEKKRLLGTLVDIGERGSHAHGSTAAFILHDLGTHDWLPGWQMVWVVVSLRRSIPRKAMFEVLLEARIRSKGNSEFERVLNRAQKEVNGISLEELDEEADRRSRELAESRLEKIKGLHKTQSDRSKSTLRSALGRLFGSRREMSRTIAVGPLEPTESDIQLASLWAGNTVSTDTAHGYFGSDSAKMLSARLAERAAAEVYSRLGYTVDDIAVQQLEYDYGAAAWKSHDLEVDGKPIDVKNSRRTSKHHYARHVVKTKGNVLGYKGVAIAGVASPLEFGSEDTLFLGQLDESSLTDIESRYKDVIELGLCTDRAKIQSHRFLPGWIYEYPKVLYKSWDNELQSLRELPTLQNHQKAASLIAELGWNSDAFATLLGHKASLREEWRVDFQRKIAEITQNGRPSLPNLFLTILSHYLDTLRAGLPPEFSPSRYRPMLFLFKETAPLGALDPLRYIRGLVETLERLHDAVSKNDKLMTYLRSCPRFRLDATGILSAARDNRRFTVLAYCGRCGKSPLIVGINETCQTCGKLRCEFTNYSNDVCGYCSANCSTS